jgi:hypothetical protein
MKLSKKQYNYYENLIDDKTYFITAKKYHGRRAVLFGNYRYSYIIYYLFLDNKMFNLIIGIQASGENL